MTVIAALIGASLLGVVGALLAIPTAAAIMLLVREVFVAQDASRGQLPGLDDDGSLRVHPVAGALDHDLADAWEQATHLGLLSAAHVVGVAPASQSTGPSNGASPSSRSVVRPAADRRERSGRGSGRGTGLSLHAERSSAS